MSQVFISTITHITPKVEDLLNGIQLRCEINGCQSVFKNSGNLQMHLQKHHKLSTESCIKDTSKKLFFCPQINCVYYDGPANEKSFKCMKFLKQHFLKVHAEKKFVCNKCSKAFSTNSMRESHEKNCGKEYICAECGWKYDSSEALLTHAKRRGHQVKRKFAEKIAIPKLVVKEVSNFSIPGPKDSQTQTEINAPSILVPPSILLPPKKRIKIEVAPEVSMFHETPLCNIETQTELKLISGMNDPMLYSNMHTQTCDEFLSELGLADIQTQTNWPAIDEDDERGRNSQFSSGAHDELMVSTETQTSFTQCLLDSCNEENSLTGSITQHTQTCDTLLEGLFGGQDSDFIGSFQSTHTQT